MIYDYITYDAQVALTDKTQASYPTKREYFWMRTLTIYYPYYLNVEDTYYRLFLRRTNARFFTILRGIIVYQVKCTNACTGFE